jgi:DNA-binding transcriptional LysR family regulator
MSFTLRQIRYFVAVAETGKVGEAAASVAISPSAVTEAIQELESITGVILFERHRRGVKLTYEGHRFLQHCRIILDAVSDATYAISSSRKNISGVLRLGTTVTVAGYMLCTPLARFRRTFPQIEVRVLEHSRNLIEKKILNEDLDLAMILTSNLKNSSAISVETLVQSKRRLWTPPNHPLLLQEKVTLEDVSQEPYIQLLIDEAEETTRKYWARYNLMPKVAFKTSSVEAVRSMVATRAGVTILSDMVYRPWSLEGDRIQSCEIADEIPTMDVGLAWRKGADLSECARVFIEFFSMGYTSGRPQHKIGLTLDPDAKSPVGGVKPEDQDMS